MGIQSKSNSNSYTSFSRASIIALLIGFGASACVASSLTQKDILVHYDAVAELRTGFEDARGRDGDLLAPTQFEQTRVYLNQAFELAREAQKKRANDAARKGLNSLQILNEKIEANESIMAEVIDIRERAREQGASTIFENDFASADEQFRKTTQLLEKQDLEKAREERPDLIRQYADLELRALKEGTVALAKKAIESAEEAGADRNAELTLQKARDELDLAISVLEADRNQVEKSNEHANKSTWLAKRAKEIDSVLDFFDDQGFTDEQKVLWYQEQLQRIHGAIANDTLPFDQSNAKVIQALRNNTLSLKSAMDDSIYANMVTQKQVYELEDSIRAQQKSHEDELQTIVESYEQHISAIQSGNKVRLADAKKNSAQQVQKLKQQLSASARAQREAERARERAQARFEKARNLFEKAEAEVFRQGDDILIRVKGFDFSPGKHKVKPKNYALLNKIVAAIQTFSESNIKIVGHTDATGSEEQNLRLSAARAQSVVEFLSSVGGIQKQMISGEGQGEKQPIASNDTAEGRAENRRIDVHIINQQPS